MSSFDAMSFSFMDSWDDFASSPDMPAWSDPAHEALNMDTVPEDVRSGSMDPQQPPNASGIIDSMGHLTGTLAFSISPEENAQQSAFSFSESAVPAAELDRDVTTATPVSADLAPTPATLPHESDGLLSMRHSSSSKSNDLLRLYRENEHRTLEDMLTQLRRHEVEKQPGDIDRSKLLYGMLWVRDSCRRNKEKSIARDRVHEAYGKTCKIHGVAKLNAANFGKCVSTVFANLKVRRLGPRGGSKYHYSEMELVAAPMASPPASPGGAARSKSPPASLSQSPSLIGDARAVSRSLSPDLTPLPQPATTAIPPEMASSQEFSTAFVDTGAPSAEGMFTVEAAVWKKLLLRTAHEEAMDNGAWVEGGLPDISPYVPPGTDEQAVRDLLAVYQRHAPVTIIKFRAQKWDSFYKSIITLPRNLTEAARQLYLHPSMSMWIMLADYSIYRPLVWYLPQLLFFDIEEMFDAFKRFNSRKLSSILLTAFAEFPGHVQRAKFRPAKLFESIIDRYVRVYQAIGPTMQSFASVEVCSMMRRDWLAAVDMFELCQRELPNCGYSETMAILKYDIVDLVDPQGAAGHAAAASPAASRPGSSSGGLPPASPGARMPHTTDILQRSVDFIKCLPLRFGKRKTHDILRAAKLVGLAALRDLTAKNCESFPHWWRFKVWFDEALEFYAEVGGFMTCPASSNSSSSSSGSGSSQATNNTTTNGSTIAAGSTAGTTQPTQATTTTATATTTTTTSVFASSSTSIAQLQGPPAPPSPAASDAPAGGMRAASGPPLDLSQLEAGFAAGTGLTLPNGAFTHITGDMTGAVGMQGPFASSVHMGFGDGRSSAPQEGRHATGHPSVMSRANSSHGGDGADDSGLGLDEGGW